MSEVLFLDNLEFEVRRSPRRKTLGLTVDRSGDLVVFSPENVGTAELCKWVEQKLLWVHQKLLRKEDFGRTIHRLETVSGESIAYLGKNYRLKIVDSQPVPLQFDGQWFTLGKKDRRDAARHFQDWYQAAGVKWLKKRIKIWESKVGISASKITVSELGFRWGSCGKTGILHFNWRLFQLPISLVDYVIVHELVHLHEHNHTREFWRILERVLPDWKERKEELGRRQTEIHWCTDSGEIRGGVKKK